MEGNDLDKSPNRILLALNNNNYMKLFERGMNDSKAIGDVIRIYQKESS